MAQTASEKPFANVGNEGVESRARTAVERMRRRVEASSAREPTLDEINAFISDVRAQRKKRVQTEGLVRA